MNPPPPLTGGGLPTGDSGVNTTGSADSADGADSTGDGGDGGACEELSNGAHYECRGYALGIYAHPVTGELRADFRGGGGVGLPQSEWNSHIWCLDPDPVAAEAALDPLDPDPVAGVEDLVQTCLPWHGFHNFDFENTSPDEAEQMIIDTAVEGCREQRVETMTDDLFPPTLGGASYDPYVFHHVECFFQAQPGYAPHPWSIGTPPMNPECPFLAAAPPPPSPNVEDAKPLQECGMCDLDESCEGYDPTLHATHTTGRTTSASLDWSWMQQLMQGTDAWTCDVGRLQFRLDPAGPEEFLGLGPGSLWYELGFRTGDKNPRAWRFDPVTKARIGNSYTIDTPENAAIAWDQLAQETYVAFQVTRSGKTQYIYITKFYT